MSKLTLMQGMIYSGDYVNALRAGTVIARSLDTTQSSDNSPLLLGLTALVIIIVICIFLYKRQGEKKLEPELKPLESFEEEQNNGNF